MLSIFSCFRKKTPPDNLKGWLEHEFPGRYEVLVSNLKMLDVMAQFRGEKRGLVADKADPDVQFFLNWEKGVEGLGLDTQAVTLAHEHARAEVVAARSWLVRLHGKELEKISIAVLDEVLIVQVFEEPAPTLRERIFSNVKAATVAGADPSPKVVFLEIMEPAVFGTEYQGIIPRGHWEAGTGWQRKNLLLSLRIESGKESAWEINAESSRGSHYHDEAYRQAKAWADKNLPKPFFMDKDRPVSFDPKPADVRPRNNPAIQYDFPFFDKDPAGSEIEPSGYVTGIYYPDEQVLAQVKKQQK
ncbi:MAG: hypothetical protein ABMA02_19245 [Saprospiraceae bacterium]